MTLDTQPSHNTLYFPPVLNFLIFVNLIYHIILIYLFFFCFCLTPSHSYKFPGGKIWVSLSNFGRIVWSWKYLDFKILNSCWNLSPWNLKCIKTYVLSYSFLLFWWFSLSLLLFFNFITLEFQFGLIIHLIFLLIFNYHVLLFSRVLINCLVILSLVKILHAWLKN